MGMSMGMGAPSIGGPGVLSMGAPPSTFATSSIPATPASSSQPGSTMPAPSTQQQPNKSASTSTSNTSGNSKSKSSSKQQASSTSATASHHLPFGQLVEKDPNEPEPFLGKLPIGRVIQAVSNTLFRAPVHHHRPRTTDFILVPVHSSPGKFVLRRAAGVWSVGQQHPIMEVPEPSERNYQVYLRKKLHVYLCREFNKNKQVFLNHVTSTFHDLLANSIKSKLRELGVARKINALDYYENKNPGKKFSEVSLREMMPPETVCCYESSQWAAFRMQQLGITRFNNPSLIPHHALAHHLWLGEEKKLLAVYLQELHLLPWVVASALISGGSRPENMSITGFGDPSGCGRAFSFQRFETKRVVDILYASDFRSIAASLPPTRVLHEFQKRDAIKQLEPEQVEVVMRGHAGFPTRDIIHSMHMWQRLAVIRFLAKDSKDQILAKIHRNTRLLYKQQMDQFHKLRSSVFETMLASMAAPSDEALPSKPSLGIDWDMNDTTGLGEDEPEVAPISSQNKDGGVWSSTSGNLLSDFDVTEAEASGTKLKLKRSKVPTQELFPSATPPTVRLRVGGKLVAAKKAATKPRKQKTGAEEGDASQQEAPPKRPKLIISQPQPPPSPRTPQSQPSPSPQ
eukprot:c7146_g1_i1.p1 GENE.c7146_g1_i1~~c7146_g1_i1.p1  ORF type:complete len:626 (-),score=150.41 c7146_g1_i1:73-1950(-)